jgi:hypothetical protein
MHWSLPSTMIHNRSQIKDFGFFHGMGCKDAKTKQLINTTMEEETKTKDK